MNILYVHRTQGGGVEGVHIRGVVNAFRKLGHHVDTLSPDSRGGETSARDGSRFARFARHAPELVFETIELAYNAVLWRRLADAFARTRYDLVYERGALFNFAPVWFCARRRVPLFLEVNFTADMPLVRRRSALLRPLAGLVDTSVLLRADHCFAVSTYLRDNLISKGRPADGVTVLTNAADPDEFRPDISGDEVRRAFGLAGKTVIGFAGGFYPWHGLKLLLAALELAVARAPQLAVLLVGDGPMRPELEDIIRARKLESHVRLAGAVPHADLPRHIAAFDVGVMPDSNVYGSPMKVFEYMSMEKPVVAADYGPLRDAIVHDRHGKLFPPGSAEALGACLVEMAVEPERRREMGRAGRELVVQDRNWIHHAERIVATYDRIAAGRISQGGPRPAREN
jgi:glycosyltransferase involved in cell wall biosynthesis